MELLNRLPKGGVCAEIGVWEGGFSEKILEVTQPKTLHLIDPWLFQPEFNNSAFGKEARRNAMDEMFDKVTERFRGDDRVVIHRKMSDAALESFEDGALDWVYIDGNHNYEVVSKDLALSVQKVKPGGMIGGDDLLWNVDKGAPVRTAVRELRRKLGDGATFYRMGQQYLFELPNG
jgi:hypothetical protein